VPSRSGGICAGTEGKSGTRSRELHHTFCLKRKLRKGTSVSEGMEYTASAIDGLNSTV
jgi:hypothetical protein